jgi:hypothetical protein
MSICRRSFKGVTSRQRSKSVAAATCIPEAAAAPDELIDRFWSLAIGMHVYDANRSAFDALINFAKIELIDDLLIRRSLREYYYLVNASPPQSGVDSDCVDLLIAVPGNISRNTMRGTDNDQIT